jgi:hypothetical protein
MTKSAVRPYIVLDGDKKRLIIAATGAAARNFVTRGRFPAHLASKTELIALLELGVRSEEATEEGETA